MTGAVLFVAVVEGGAVAGEDGDAETVLDREENEGSELIDTVKLIQ